MPQIPVERRQGRRVDVQAPLHVRRLGTSQSAPFKEELTANVSLSGLYFETDHRRAYNENDVIIASVSIPDSQRREFPFTRLAGRSRVVRVNELPSPKSESRERIGVALEFSRDMTALTAIPMRA